MGEGGAGSQTQIARDTGQPGHRLLCPFTSGHERKKPPLYETHSHHQLLPLELKTWLVRSGKEVCVRLGLS